MQARVLPGSTHFCLSHVCCPCEPSNRSSLACLHLCMSLKPGGLVPGKRLDGQSQLETREIDVLPFIHVHTFWRVEPRFPCVLFLCKKNVFRHCLFWLAWICSHLAGLLLYRQNQDFNKWSCGLMDKALVFGTKDCRLESCQDQGCSVPFFLCTAWH